MIAGGRKSIEIERKSIGAKSAQKQSKNRAKTGLCEISQPLRDQHLAAKPFRSLNEVAAKSTYLCGSGHPFRNHFVAPFSPLQKFSKLRTQVWHTSATSQHRSPHFAATKRLRSDKAWKSLISQPKFHSAGYFAIAKAILAHVCHFAAPYTHFRAAKSLLSCEMVCENATLLRNDLQASKWLRNHLQA